MLSKVRFFFHEWLCNLRSTKPSFVIRFSWRLVHPCELKLIKTVFNWSADVNERYFLQGVVFHCIKFRVPGFLLLHQPQAGKEKFHYFSCNCRLLKEKEKKKRKRERERERETENMKKERRGTQASPTRTKRRRIYISRGKRTGNIEKRMNTKELFIGTSAVLLISSSTALPIASALSCSLGARPWGEQRSTGMSSQSRLMPGNLCKFNHRSHEWVGTKKYRK